jgi:hypothetical protein
MEKMTDPTIELIPFTAADIDRLIGWIPSLESLRLWTASSFDYPLTREHLQGHLRDRVGFRREGVRRESFKAPGESGAPGGYWSEITMSVLAPEWEALRLR